MTLPPENALQNLSREELIAILLQMAADMRRLEAEVQRLQAEVERLKKPPPTSQNSSRPPARDWQSNSAGRKRHRSRAASPGMLRRARWDTLNMVVFCAETLDSDPRQGSLVVSADLIPGRKP